MYRIADDETGSGSDAVRVNSTSGDVTAAKRFDWESTDVVSVRVLAEDSGRPSRTGYSMVSVHIEEEDMDHHHRLAFSQRKYVRARDVGNHSFGAYVRHVLKCCCYPHMSPGKQAVDISFVCVFVRLRISPPRIQLAASNYARRFVDVQGRQSQIFVNVAPPEAQNRTNRPARGSRPPACKHYRRYALT